MNILYHHRTRAEDAQGIHIRALCEAFESLGHQVQVVGPVDPSRRRIDGASRSAARESEGAHLFGLAVPAWLYELLAMVYNIPAFIVLMFYLLRDRPQIVYERYALFNVAGRLAAGLFRVPFVLEVNAPLSLELKHHGGLVFRGVAQRVEDWLCRSATRTVVVSEAMAAIFRARGVPGERLMVVPNGVDRRHFNPGVDGARIRDSYKLDNRIVIGFVGWVRPWHGVDRLLEAVATLAAATPDLSVLVVGDGPALPGLRTLAQRLGIADRVIFTGAVEQHEVPEFLAAMDIAVQPDVTAYASPIKLFEYLALGKAIVAPRRPNIEEVVEDGRHALLFSPGDTAELASAIGRLCRDEVLRTRIGNAAYRLSEQNGYYWDANARRVLEAVGL